MLWLQLKCNQALATRDDVEHAIRELLSLMSEEAYLSIVEPAAHCCHRCSKIRRRSLCCVRRPVARPTGFESVTYGSGASNVRLVGSSKGSQAARVGRLTRRHAGQLGHDARDRV